MPIPGRGARDIVVVREAHELACVSRLADAQQFDHVGVILEPDLVHLYETALLARFSLPLRFL